MVLAWLNDYSFYCQPVDYSYDPRAIEVCTNEFFFSFFFFSISRLIKRVLIFFFFSFFFFFNIDELFETQITRMVWLYFLIKLFDLLDTVFFVLRKKQQQISFLHVYHHTGMTFGTWVCTKFLPGGHITLLGKSFNPFTRSSNYINMNHIILISSQIFSRIMIYLALSILLLLLF